jgi:hypothetical protein
MQQRDADRLQPIREAQARQSASRYLAQTLGATYGLGAGSLRHDRWVFPVLAQQSDAHRVPMVGVIVVNAQTALLEPLSATQIADMQEAGAVQTAQARGELARNEQGYVLRSHARIKASVWISDRVDLKVGASGGAWIPFDDPIWRFSISFHQEEADLEPLGIIDVDATTGRVHPLTPEQIQAIQESVRAAKQHPTLAAAA